MEVVDINILSENERAVNYIRDINVEVIMMEKHFKAHVIIEQHANKKPDIHIECDGCGYYPEEELKNVVRNYIRKHIQRYIR